MQTLDTLDSRALRAVDCYGQRFMREGGYAYHVLPSGGGALSQERPFKIDVTPRKSDGKMKQHHVAVAWDGSRFIAQRETLTIEAGDLATWNCPDVNAPPFEIAGDKSFFCSASLVNECGFSHAFGLPGHYEWVDANGSGLKGVVRVKAVHCAKREDLANWRAQIARAALVMISHAKAEPAEVDIVVGQTVYFAIVTGPGVTITDARLAAAQYHCDGKRKRD